MSDTAIVREVLVRRLPAKPDARDWKALAAIERLSKLERSLMSYVPRDADTTTYTADDGTDCFALVTADNGDKINLTFQNPGDGSWSIATDVPKNSDRLK